MVFKSDVSASVRPRVFELVELCYRYAFLEGKARAGVRLGRAQQEELAALRQRLRGDPEFGRRGHLRFRLELPAAVKTPEGQFPATVLNLSGNGMYVITTVDAAIGAKVQVRICRPGVVEYVFSCVVRHGARHEHLIGLGLSFCSVPLEIRGGV